MVGIIVEEWLEGWKMGPTCMNARYDARICLGFFERSDVYLCNARVAITLQILLWVGPGKDPVSIVCATLPSWASLHEISCFYFKFGEFVTLFYFYSDSESLYFFFIF